MHITQKISPSRFDCLVSAVRCPLHTHALNNPASRTLASLPPRASTYLNEHLQHRDGRTHFWHFSAACEQECTTKTWYRSLCSPSDSRLFPRKPGSSYAWRCCTVCLQSHCKKTTNWSGIKSHLHERIPREEELLWRTRDGGVPLHPSV